MAIKSAGTYMQISDLCKSCSKQNFCGNGMTDYYCTGYAPCVETRCDIWKTLGEDMSDVEKYYYVAVDPHTSKKSCLAFLKLLKKRAERIDHVCGRLIEEMEKEKHECDT